MMLNFGVKLINFQEKDDFFRLESYKIAYNFIGIIIYCHSNIHFMFVYLCKRFWYDNILP